MAEADHRDWWVDERCIDCGAAQTIAPDFVHEKDGVSVFVRQPSGAAEIADAWRAVLLCPTASVHAPAGLKPPDGLFPQELAPGLHRLGYNARASWGAHSYTALVGGVRVMVDSPRWTGHIADWLAAQGGLDHVLLTHRDDVADAQRYAERFKARVWIHADDAAAAPFATDRVTGEEAREILPGIRVISLPGHTRGSVAWLAQGWLFTGDSLAWSFAHKGLQAFRDACWYDWTIQLGSLARLRRESFNYVLAGHGGSIQLDAEKMQSELAAMLARYGGTAAP